MRTLLTIALVAVAPTAAVAHGGGLNRCGCHVDHSTGQCHCYQGRGCGCSCEPDFCQQILENARRGQQPPTPTPAPQPEVAPLIEAPEPLLEQDATADTSAFRDDDDEVGAGCGVE